MGDPLVAIRMKVNIIERSCPEYKILNGYENPTFTSFQFNIKYRFNKKITFM